MFGAVGTRPSVFSVMESPHKRKLSGRFYAALAVLAFNLPGTVDLQTNRLHFRSNFGFFVTIIYVQIPN